MFEIWFQIHHRYFITTEFYYKVVSLHNVVKISIPDTFSGDNNACTNWISPQCNVVLLTLIYLYATVYVLNHLYVHHV